MQVGKDVGGWETGGLSSTWHIANAQLLYHGNRLFDFVYTTATGSLHCVIS